MISAIFCKEDGLGMRFRRASRRGGILSHKSVACGSGIRRDFVTLKRLLLFCNDGTLGRICENALRRKCALLFSLLIVNGLRHNE